MEKADTCPHSRRYRCRMGDGSPCSCTGFLAGEEVRASEEGQAAFLRGWEPVVRVTAGPAHLCCGKASCPTQKQRIASEGQAHCSPAMCCCSCPHKAHTHTHTHHQWYRLSTGVGGTLCHHLRQKCMRYKHAAYIITHWAFCHLR